MSSSCSVFPQNNTQATLCKVIKCVWAYFLRHAEEKQSSHQESLYFNQFDTNLTFVLTRQIQMLWEKCIILFCILLFVSHIFTNAIFFVYTHYCLFHFSIRKLVYLCFISCQIRKEMHLFDWQDNERKLRKVEEKYFLMQKLKVVFKIVFELLKVLQSKKVRIIFMQMNMKNW